MFDGRFNEGFVALLAAQDSGTGANRQPPDTGIDRYWWLLGISTVLPLAILACAALIG